MKTLIIISMFAVFGSFLFINSGTISEKVKTKTDTIDVGYTYWWPSGGPFIGLCGDKYSIVFTGKVTKLFNPSPDLPNGRNVGEVTYTPQEGVIMIDQVLCKRSPEEGYKKTPGRNFNNEKYFSSNCFYKSGLSEGDMVIVFIYSYEGEYSIPGNSILKISSFNDEAVTSIEKYIKNGQDPLVIESDTAIWRRYGLDYALKEIIKCRKNSGK